MRRSLFIFVVISFVIFFCAADLLAEDFWPAIPRSASAFRGTGYYFSWLKIFASWLLFMIWVKTTDWVNIDCEESKVMDYHRWNPIVFVPFMAAFILFWMIPIFLIGYILLFLAYIGPLGAYIIIRNSKLTSNMQVLTPEHIRYLSAKYLNKIGMKVAYEKPDPHEAGPPIKVFAQGGADERMNAAHLLSARQSPGLITAREILADALAFRATAIMLDYSAKSVAMNIMVDGVWLPRENLNREQADVALMSMKILCGLNPQDRQARQEGKFGAEFGSARYLGTLTSQGTSTGERAIVQFEEKKIRFKSLDQLGMRPKLQEQVRDLLALRKGLALFAAPPANGLRSSLSVILHNTDRFTREFSALEEENNRYEPVENVPVMTYNAAQGQAPEEILIKIFRLEPNVVVVRDLVNAKIVSMMCREIVENRLMISTIRAKDCADALLRVLALGIPAGEFAKSISGVLCQRLIRRLCETCKEAYVPTQQILQQLGIPEGRISAFYRPRQPAESNKSKSKDICKVCNGIGYTGRIALYELLVVGDNVRKVLASNPKIDLLRQAARKDGMVSLQEEGILLVAKGITSLPELMRILKQ
jgi:type II secretory ATPase GspE/PulE/Tfp pilus assembly ATPase PilB-like protein